jgi:hypothetical protein
MIIPSSRTVSLGLSAQIAPQMGCQSAPRIQGRRQRPPPFHGPRDWHLQPPSCLYYTPMSSATLQCCMIPTNFSSAPCAGFLSWRWRKYIDSVLLHACALTLQFPSYGDTPLSSLHPLFSLVCYSCTLSVSLVPTLVSLFAPLPHPHVCLVMPRLRRKPKRGPLWYQNKAAMASRHPPILHSCA